MQSLKTIPPETKEYLSMVTDPYHDRNLRVSGFPDGVNMTSVVRRLAFQTSLTCPFTLTTGESWDFHIFATPLHQRTVMRACSININTITPGVAPEGINTINIFYRKYSTLGAVSEVRFQALGQAAGTISPANDGPGRTVSLAFELHNTTAEIYKSGSLTCYRTNALNQRCDLRIARSPAATSVGYTADIILNIPDTLEQANLIPNARTWEASKGIYSVCLPPKDNRYVTGVYSNIIMNINRTSTPYLVYADGYDIEPAAAPAWSPLNCTGVISSKFADANQTFTLDMRQVLEYFPNSVSSTLLPFATTAPEVDRLFLKMYQKMINRIEPGVPVGFNSAGEWFRRITQLAKETLPTLQHLIPPQYQKYTAAIGPIADKAADLVLDMIDKPKPQPVVVQVTQPQKAKTSKPKIKINPKLRKQISGLRFSAGAQRMIKANRA